MPDAVEALRKDTGLRNGLRALLRCSNLDVAHLCGPRDFERFSNEDEERRIRVYSQLCTSSDSGDGRHLLHIP